MMLNASLEEQPILHIPWSLIIIDVSRQHIVDLHNSCLASPFFQLSPADPHPSRPHTNFT